MGYAHLMVTCTITLQLQVSKGTRNIAAINRRNQLLQRFATDGIVLEMKLLEGRGQIPTKLVV